MFSKELYSKLRYLLKKKRNFNEICRELGLKDYEVMLLINSLDDSSIYTQLFGEGFKLYARAEINESIYRLYPNKEHLRLGMIGDIHLCNKSCDIDAVTEAYVEFEEGKVDYVLHCGDVFEGLLKQDEEYKKILLEATYEGQLEYGIRHYPMYNGKTYAVSGNHDDTWYSICRREIIADMAGKRPDIVYLGANRRSIAIDGLNIELVHGSILNDGRKNFKIGDYLRSVPQSRRPHIVHYGHTHYNPLHNMVFGVECFRTSAFLRNNPYYRSRGYEATSPQIYIVDVYFDDDGKVKKITSKRKIIDK